MGLETRPKHGAEACPGDRPRVEGAGVGATAEALAASPLHPGCSGLERHPPGLSEAGTGTGLGNPRTLRVHTQNPYMAKTAPAHRGCLCSPATSFVVDEVSSIIKEAIESAIGGNAYQHSKVNQWTTSVVEQTLSQLTKLGKPFKYIVTCVIMQKNGAGLHTASSCFWDNSSDGTCTVRWENKTMYCIVSAFGLAI
nr:PREDICTED: dynein light chain Tctex-type 1 [Opisthocomus hoazin]